MAEAVTNPTLNTLSQLEEQNIQALKTRIEQERQARLAAARGQAISRGLQGSSFESRAVSEVNRLADEAMANGEREIRGQYSGQRLQIEEQELTRRWQSLEEEKNRAFQSGEQEKARQFEEQQAALERNAQEMMSRREGRAALASTGAQIGTLALLNKGSLFGGGGAAGAGAPTSGIFTSALNKAGQGLFGAGANPAGGAIGPSLPTFGQGFSTPYAQGVAPGGAGAVGQATGAAAGIIGGSYAGQQVADSLFGQKYNNDKAVSRGGKIGAAAGSTIGTALFGAKGGLAGGAIGATLGANAGEGLRMVSSSGAGASDNKGITFQNIARGVARKPLQAIGGMVGGGVGVKVANTVTKAAKKLFCFLPETLIEMANGAYKPIGKVKLGDETKGGIVESIRESMSNDLFKYKGISVTGSHAVLDGGKWKRVWQAGGVERVPGSFKVISIVTSKHRVYVGDVVLGDEFETDDYEEINPDQSIDALNAQEEKKYATASV